MTNALHKGYKRCWRSNLARTMQAKRLGPRSWSERRDLSGETSQRLRSLQSAILDDCLRRNRRPKTTFRAYRPFIGVTDVSCLYII
jgi:hypothetical protein